MSDAKYGIKRMLLQLSRSAKSPYVKLRALELVMLHDGYDLAVLSNSPSGKVHKKKAGSLKDLAVVEPAYNQEDGFLQCHPKPDDSESARNLSNLAK